MWSEARDSKELEHRIRALPGFGDMKVNALGATLAKRFGVRAAEASSRASRPSGTSTRSRRSRRTRPRSAPTRRPVGPRLRRPDHLLAGSRRGTKRRRWHKRPSLIDLSRAHLIKEAWSRVNGEWAGYEVHRRSPSGTEQKPRPPNADGGRAFWPTCCGGRAHGVPRIGPMREVSRGDTERAGAPNPRPRLATRLLDREHGPAITVLAETVIPRGFPRTLARTLGKQEVES